MHGVLIEDALHETKFHIHSNADGLRLAYLAPPPADALLLCGGDTLLDDRRAALATEPQARQVNVALKAIVERRRAVAATCIDWKAANVKLAVRRIAANAMGSVRNSADDPRTGRTVAQHILRPGSSFEASEIDGADWPRLSRPPYVARHSFMN
jgi:hypothetical protein